MSITFKEIMGYVPGHNETVFHEIEDSLGQLLPFVGAGLTADFYGTWNAALKALSAGITDEAAKDELDALLDSRKNLEAAQLIEDRHGKNNLQRDMIRHFSRQKLLDNREAMKRQAIDLLPLLFPCPVLTTNFDEAIELVYNDRGHQSIPVLNPTSRSLRDQATRLFHTPCVFKLHGTVSDTMIDYDDIVFTEAQYDRHYASDSPIREALRVFLDRRSMLFLGCRLEQDRTVDVIRDTASPGSVHFAIISCEENRRDERIRELDDLNIRAILYPKGQHDAVRVILEMLLRGRVRSAYDSLPYHASALPAPPENPYVYHERMTALFGRDDELQRLLSFVTDSRDPFRWWALVGAGGSGKSRLAMELCDKVGALPGWDCRILRSNDYDDLRTTFASFTQSTLVVADYVQAHARELGSVMEALANEPLPFPLRVLLVERTGKGAEMSGFDWTRQLYENVHDESKFERLCWKPDFLQLEPLTDAALTEIIKAFAASLRDKNISTRQPPDDAQCKTLMDRLYAIDPDLRRPLYALFLTGAWMDGQDPARWNRERVLEDIIKKENKRLDERICQVTRIDDRKGLIYEDCLYLYSLSTAMLGASPQMVRDHCPKLWADVTRDAEDTKLRDPKTLLARLGLLHGDKLIAMEPDLMGEYFVYRWLVSEEGEKHREAFLQAVWSKPENAFVFCDRLFSDYKHLLNENPAHWTLLLPPPDQPVYDGSPFTAWQMASLCVNAIADCELLSSCQDVFRILEMIFTQFPNNWVIAAMLAVGLFNLSSKQDAEDAALSVDRIAALLARFHDNREIAVTLASGLVNLSNKQDAECAAQTVDRIAALLVRFPGDRVIAMQLAVGLGLLRQNHSISVTDRADALGRAFPDDEQIQGIITAIRDLGDP